ncbi:hypothetical protein Plhal304r1_c008g0032591 [Plasmopara halstedii]
MSMTDFCQNKEHKVTSKLPTVMCYSQILHLWHTTCFHLLLLLPSLQRCKMSTQSHCIIQSNRNVEIQQGQNGLILNRCGRDQQTLVFQGRAYSRNGETHIAGLFNRIGFAKSGRALASMQLRTI